MANHQLLFGRPLVADETLPPLSVTGALEDYTSGEAYDSELDINNSVGRCTLTVLESTLPPGARVFIDQLRKKVVVRWDAYTPPVETVQLVPNGDFEAGDDGRWSLGPGWTIGSGEDYPVQDGTHSARFKDYRGTSDMVLASVPAKTNDYIKIDAMIQHGASSEGNVGARVSLVWRAEDGRELDRNWGNYISSGSKGAWKTSTAEGYGPGDARYVSVVLSAKRSRQNHGLFVDKITWNHTYAIGQDGDDFYHLSIAVTDGLNRTAYWSGGLEEAGLWLTSAIYPVPQDLASVGVSGSALAIRHFTELRAFSVEVADVGVRASVLAVSLRKPLVTNDSYTEAVGLAGSSLSVSHRAVRLNATFTGSEVGVAGNATGISHSNVRREAGLQSDVGVSGSVLSVNHGST